MEKMQNFYITAVEKISLNDLLLEHLPVPHQAETVITAGGVWYGRRMRITNPGHILKKGDTVRVYTSPDQGLYYAIDENRVVFEDEDLLVLYKPCNLNVHAVPASLYYNLSYGVSRYLKKRGIHMEATPPNRLDRPVEGLVAFAKNKNSERELFKLVRKGRISKWYMAALEKGKGIHRLKICDRISSQRSTTKLDPAGKNAVSCFVRAESLENADIYSVFPLTGRRHQIRFHASHYLTPIIGDTRYGSRFFLKPDEIALMCRGFNFPMKGKNLRIRVNPAHIEAFYKKIQQAQPVSSK
ncbi:MAG: hypothetical protein KAT34_20160, partial [Candidatus Aminicenantes bacterium]|nr:hypothetical protein [Candidatus Aminicenantes bacterium]